jgi:hypothetical protein
MIASLTEGRTAPPTLDLPTRLDVDEAKEVLFGLLGSFSIPIRILSSRPPMNLDMLDVFFLNVND